MSNAVRKTGRNECDLCRKRGSQRNPLTRHHVNGNSKDNDPLNHMVVHRILCHTWADYITQMFASKGEVATAQKIEKAWTLIHTSDWLYRLVYHD